jgi:hypothetical protein
VLHSIECICSKSIPERRSACCTRNTDTFGTRNILAGSPLEPRNCRRKRRERYFQLDPASCESDQERATLGGRPMIGEGGGGGASVLYVTPNGQVIQAPQGYQAVPAENGRGLVLLPQGQALGNNSLVTLFAMANQTR